MKKKFVDAFNGIKLAMNHSSVVIQFILALMAIVGGLIVHLDYYEWLAFIICIGLVIMSEIFNTSIEKIGDYLNSKFDKRIKTIKDLSSAAVLISSICSLLVCIFVILRRVIK